MKRGFDTVAHGFDAGHGWVASRDNVWPLPSQAQPLLSVWSNVALCSPRHRNVVCKPRSRLIDLLVSSA